MTLRSGLRLALTALLCIAGGIGFGVILGVFVFYVWATFFLVHVPPAFPVP